MLDDYPVVLTLPVRWGDMDAIRHVNNTVYFRYFESARIVYLERMAVVEGGGFPRRIGPILASTSCRFRAPVTYPDTVQAGARVTDVGEDRFRMEYAVASEKLGRLAATGEGLIVTYDYERGHKVPLPDDWRAAIDAIEART